MAASLISRPVYWLGSRLYLNVTAQCNAVPLCLQRGPGFAMPEESGFSKLDFEPSVDEMFDAVEDAYKNDERKDIVGMGENDGGVIFAGYGEPLLRLDEITEAAQRIKESRHGVPLSIKSNGLFPGEDGVSVAQRLKSSGIDSASIFVPCANPKQFDEIMKPASPDLNFGKLCEFIVSLTDNGVQVKASTVSRQGVDVNEIRQLAAALGATETQVKAYFD
mmetsp:Transcript_39658/g.64333  ORF Transcript_39658/g.64333 Transcript_39658/m.64333 type:complete len:220 (+) Transcript_39658:220-879(+)